MELKREIIAEEIEVMSIKELAAKYNIPYSKMWNYITENHIFKTTSYDKLFTKLQESNNSVEEIANELNLSVSYVEKLYTRIIRVHPELKRVPMYVKAEELFKLKYTNNRVAEELHLALAYVRNCRRRYREKCSKT